MRGGRSAAALPAEIATNPSLRSQRQPRASSGPVTRLSGCTPCFVELFLVTNKLAKDLHTGHGTSKTPREALHHSHNRARTQKHTLYPEHLLVDTLRAACAADAVACSAEVVEKLPKSHPAFGCYPFSPFSPFNPFACGMGNTAMSRRGRRG